MNDEIKIEYSDNPKFIQKERRKNRKIELITAVLISVSWIYYFWFEKLYGTMWENSNNEFRIAFTFIVVSGLTCIFLEYRKIGWSILIPILVILSYITSSSIF